MSTFGFSGPDAPLVIEEFTPEPETSAVREVPGQGVTCAAKPPARCHPLIDADVSSPGERVFAKYFSHRDSILRDHVFDGVRVLPAVAIIEMAREAVARTGVRPRQITYFLMGYPIMGTEQGIDTRLVLKPAGVVCLRVGSTDLDG